MLNNKEAYTEDDRYGRTPRGNNIMVRAVYRKRMDMLFEKCMDVQIRFVFVLCISTTF